RGAALVGRDRGTDTGGGRARDRIGVAEQLAERALAREADDHRPTECRQLVEAADQLEVVVDRLAEANSGVEADPLLGNAGLDGEHEPFLEERSDLAHHVVVAWLA